MKYLVRTFPFIIFLWGIFFCAPGAADVEAENEDKAKEAFKSGSDLFEQGQYAAAAIQFRIAYKNKPTWKLLYNIGQCETGAKRYGLALEAFETYLVEAGDDITIDRRDEVRKETVRLREMVGSLKVSGPEGAEVFVDGFKRGTLPLSGFVPVTATVEHNISGLLDGRKLSVATVKVLASQVFEVELTVEAEDATNPTASIPASEDSPRNEEEASESISQEAEAAQTETTSSAHTDSPNAPPENNSDKLKTFGWITVAVGGVLLASSIGTGAAALSKENELTSQCLDGYEGYECVVLDTSSNNDLARQRDILGGVTTGLWIGGGVAVAAGVTMLLISRKRREQLSKYSISPVATSSTIGGLLQIQF